MRKIAIPAVALLILACSTIPSQRLAVVLDGPNGRITCFKPPPDVMTATANAAVNANISKVVQALKVESSASATYDRIREETPDLQATEVLEFRLCTEYGNGILSKEQYNYFLSVLPLLKTQQPAASGEGRDANETVIDFDIDTDSAPGHTIAAAPYLHKFGISVSHLDPPASELVIMNNRVIYGGSAIEPGKTQNVLMQLGTNNVPASFELEFGDAVAEMTFVRPKLYSATPSGITHPAWKAGARDQNGNELSSQSEGLTRSLGDIPLQIYTLRAPGFQNIASVVFQSDPRLNGVPFAGFSSLLIERLTFRRR